MPWVNMARSRRNERRRSRGRRARHRRRAFGRLGGGERGARGASVILADKGHCGTSGVTATAGPGHWWVPPDPTLRAQAIERKWAISGGLAERDWMARILDLTWKTLPTLASHYRFPKDDDGVTQFRAQAHPSPVSIRTRRSSAGVMPPRRSTANDVSPPRVSSEANRKSSAIQGLDLTKATSNLGKSLTTSPLVSSNWHRGKLQSLAARTASSAFAPRRLSTA